MSLAAALLLPATLAAAPPAQIDTTPEFCLAVQHALAGTALPAQVQLHTEFQSFKESKASGEPLILHQYVSYLDEARTQPTRISCKTKSADYLRDAYGEQAAGTSQGSCRDVNRATVLAVWRALAPSERANAAVRPDTLMLDGDLTTVMGSKWVADYPHVYAGEDGRVHVHAKALRVDWNSLLWSWAPDRVRGVHYCHLVAPEYVRALMRGTASAPPRPAETS